MARSKAKAVPDPKVTERACLTRICEFRRLQKQSPTKSGFELYGETGYEQHWDHITQEQIARYLRRDPELVTIWRYYDADARVDENWFLEEAGSLWCVLHVKNGKESHRCVFRAADAACAYRVRMEMERYHENRAWFLKHKHE